MYALYNYITYLFNIYLCIKERGVKLNTMNKVTVKDKITIEKLIYEIRGVQVMLDSDLARLYKCSNGTKDINKAVKRNQKRFPENFMFQLTSDEYYSLRSQIGTLKNGRGQHSKYLPYAFTEQGVAMLSSVLHSETAISTSIRIINAFVSMRRYISSNLIEQKYINNMVLEHEEEIKLLQESFNKFEEKKKINEIYFNGQIYDAYSKILEIFKSAKKDLIIIDAYADNTILDIIKRLSINVTIITKKDNLLTKQDIERYNKQYSNLSVIYNSTFHDRYFILDKTQVYHCGSSINRIGYKTFSINIISDNETCKSLIDKINKITIDKTIF